MADEPSAKPVEAWGIVGPDGTLLIERIRRTQEAAEQGVRARGPGYRAVKLKIEVME